MRDKGEFSKILDMLYDGTLTDSVKEGLWIVWQKILGNDVNEDINEELINHLESQMNKYDETHKKNLSSLDTIKLQSTKSVIGDRWSKINNVNTNQTKKFDEVIKGTQTIKKGDKGELVRKIQNMLISIGFELGNSGKNKNGVDGDFGETTENAIKEFQKLNSLKETGVIDKLTATQLNKDYNER
jgi:murein L,D-transpeptidase YcbB/YkuD